MHPDRPFIPAYLTDNPHLDAVAYQEMLREMTPEERSRLEDGNWEARKDARFKRRWIRYINLYQQGYSFLDELLRETTILPFNTLNKIFVTVDCAATVKAGPVDDQTKTRNKNSYTVISVWGITSTYKLLWLDCRKFRKEIPDIIETLVQINDQWNPQFNKIECNGLGIGVAQYAALAGLPVVKNIRKPDKLENSISAQILMKNGQIYIPSNTAWIEQVEDDIFSWTGLPTEEDDVVDTLADAATELSPQVARDISAPTLRRSLPKAIPQVVSSYSKIPHYGL
jgi:phage terminase large subunit-like protein